jgi:hypothetical protein
MDRGDEVGGLIGGLAEWNNGAGISPEDWIGCVGSFELAIGYSLIFWPRFVLVDGHVLRQGFDDDIFNGCRKPGSSDRGAVEALMNHLHILDLHSREEAETEAQLRYLGRVLKNIHEAKLRSDFPNRRFTVEFNDQPGLDLVDYQLTFWQP